MCVTEINYKEFHRKQVVLAHTTRTDHTELHRVDFLQMKNTCVNTCQWGFAIEFNALHCIPKMLKVKVFLHKHWTKRWKCFAVSAKYMCVIINRHMMMNMKKKERKMLCRNVHCTHTNNTYFIYFCM